MKTKYPTDQFNTWLASDPGTAVVWVQIAREEMFAARQAGDGLGPEEIATHAIAMRLKAYLEDMCIVVDFEEIARRFIAGLT